MSTFENIISNGLSRIDKTFDNSGYTFTSLDISGKEITIIDEIRGFPHLRYINLSNNKIKDFTPIDDVRYLLGIDVSGNEIETPPTFKNKYLQIVNLSNNQLISLDGINGTSIRSIIARDNKIIDLKGINNCKSLTMLNLSSNLLENLNSLSEPILTLKHLILENNHLTDLIGIDILFPELEKLIIKSNKEMKSMDQLEPLKNLNKLVNLDLTDCPVTLIESYRLEIILCLPHLQELDSIKITDDEKYAACNLKNKREEDNSNNS